MSVCASIGAVNPVLRAVGNSLRVRDTERDAGRRLGVEPMTCPPNASAPGESILVLEPGESATSIWGIATDWGE
jgi:galactose mutarotase-like enzyme